MSAARLVAAGIGAIMLLAGAFVSGDDWLTLFRSETAHAPLRLAGAGLFRAGLIACGLTAALLAWRPLRIVESETMGGEGHARGDLAILTGVLAVALALRLPHLDSGIWNDEIIAWVAYMHLTPGEILTTYDDQSNHMLFTLLARCSFLVFGESTWALRLPAVLLGVASIGALYLFAGGTTTRREKWLAIALVTVSYHHVWFSQNARGYTGLLLWTLLSSWLLVRLLRGGPSRLWIGYAATAALGAFTHLSMGLIVAGHVLVCAGTLLCRLRNGQAARWWPALIGFTLTGLMTFQLHALVLPQVFGGGGSTGPRDVVATWNNPLWTALETARSMGAGGVVALVAIAVLGLGAWSYARRDPIVLAVALVPPAVAGATMLAAGYTMFPRFFFFELGFAVLLVVRGAVVAGELCARWISPLRAQGARLGTAACIGMCALSAGTLRAAYLPKQDFEGPIELIGRERRPGDAVATVGVATMPYQRHYRTGWSSAATSDELHAIASAAERTWLVYTLPLHLREARPDVMKLVDEQFEVVQEFHGTLGGGVVVVCRSAR